MTTILIVEDNPITQRVLGLTLSSRDYHIIQAGNGVEALARLNDTPIDLMLSDVNMPQMDGLTLLRHVRDDQRFMTLPVIMLTANGQEAIRSTAVSLGADGFLTKPVGSQELLETISRCIYAKT
jgi:CheY-like chemotaxis protein